MKTPGTLVTREEPCRAERLRDKINRLLGSEGKRYAANTGWLLAQKGLGLPLSLIVGIYVARYLGVQSFGMLSFAQGLVALFSAVAVLGLDSILVRELIRRPDEHGALMGSAFGLRVIASLVAMGALFVALPFLGLGEGERAVAVVCSFSLLFNPSSIFACHFQAQVQGKVIAIVSVIQLIASAGLRLLLVALNADVVWFAAAMVGDALVLTVLFSRTYFSAVRGERFARFQFRSEIARGLLRKSWPLLFSGLALSIYMKLDQVMIQLFLGSKEVGQYSAAVKISESWLMLAVILTTSLYPALVAARERSEALFREKLEWFYGLMLWLALTIAAPFSYFSRPIIHLIYGPEFMQAAPVLSVHVWSGVLVFMITASSRWYLTADHETGILYRAVFGAILNVGLNFYLIPRRGIVGAAEATLVSYAAMAILYDILDPRGRASLKIKFLAIAFPFTMMKMLLKGSNHPEVP